MGNSNIVDLSIGLLDELLGDLSRIVRVVALGELHLERRASARWDGAQALLGRGHVDVTSGSASILTVPFTKVGLAGLELDFERASELEFTRSVVESMTVGGLEVPRGDSGALGSGHDSGDGSGLDKGQSREDDSGERGEGNHDDLRGYS